MSEQYNDPRRLFRLWKDLTGEDLLSDIEGPEEAKGKGKSQGAMR